MPSRGKGNKFHPRVLVWSDLTLDNVEEIKKTDSPEDLQCLLASILHLSEWKEDLRQGILVDLYFYTLQYFSRAIGEDKFVLISAYCDLMQRRQQWFSKDNKFTSEQMSAWFSIIKSVHEMTVDTPYGNVEPVFEYFKELLLCHSVKRPPYSVALFSVDQVKKLTTYTVNTYFRHFKMYKYAFTPKNSQKYAKEEVRLDLSFQYVGLPASPEPSQAGEGDNGEEGELEQADEGTEKAEETTAAAVEEDTPAVKELKAIINSALTEQVQQLKISVDSQMKAKDEEIAKKIGISSDVPGPSKSPKSKGKKGK